MGKKKKKGGYFKAVVDAAKRQKLLHLSQTNIFQAKINLPRKVKKYLRKEEEMTDLKLGNLSLLCSSASLPGSSLATHDVTTDYQGVSEKIPYRRIFDQQLSLEFYVDYDYDVIRTLDGWMDYIGGLYKGDNDDAYFSPYAGFRQEYPNNYRTDIFVSKFEKNMGGFHKDTLQKAERKTALVYRFINAFPIQFNAIPVSYGTADVMRCTVAFSFTRYIKEYKEKVPKN